MRILIQLSPVPWYRVVRVILILALLGVVAWFLWQIRGVATPFLIAFFIASLLDPIVTRLQKRGMSRGRAVGSIFVLAFLVILLGGILLGRAALPQMTAFAENAPSYAEDLKKRADEFYTVHRSQLKFIGIKDNPVSTKSGPVADAVKGALSGLNATLTGLAGQVLWLVLIPLSMIYFLIDYPLLRARLISFVPLRHQSSVDRMSVEVVEIFSDYARSLAKMCVIYGAIATLLLVILRLPYALFLGPAAGVLYAVPYVGPAVALASCGIVALTTNGSVGYAAAVVAVFALMHVLVDNVVTPRVVGGSVGLHPLVNIFALMCGATLFGVWGMLLAVPVAASIQMLLIYFYPRLAEKPVVAGPPTASRTPPGDLPPTTTTPPDQAVAVASEEA